MDSCNNGAGRTRRASGGRQDGSTMLVHRPSLGRPILVHAVGDGVAGTYMERTPIATTLSIRTVSCVKKGSPYAVRIRLPARAQCMRTFS